MSDQLTSNNPGSSSYPEDDFLKRIVLAKVDKSKLTALRVEINRPYITELTKTPIDRSIDDPEKISKYVHIKGRGKFHVPVFGRGIKVNQDFSEDNHVYIEDNSNTSESIYSNKSHGNRERNYRSRSRSIHRDRSRTVSSDRSKSSRIREHSESFEYELDCPLYKPGDSCPNYLNKSLRHSRSPSREKTSEHDRARNYSPEYRRKYRGRRSISPLKPGEYKPSHPDKTLRYKRSVSRERHSESVRQRSKNHSPGRNETKKYSTRRTKSRSPRRRSRTPSKYKEYRSSERRRSPTKSEYYLRRRSRSMSPYYKSRGDRSRSPRRHGRSRSPHYNRHEKEMPDYGYYEAGWLGARLGHNPIGYPMQRFPPPDYYPRGMIPGPFITPGPMMRPRIPIMNKYGIP